MMKKRTKLVLDYLKPKVKALGFNKEELESIAADLADNLNLDENASDEEEDEAAKTAAESAIPYLKVAQKASGRAIQKYKEEHSEPDDDDETDDTSVQKNNQDKNEEIPAWAKAIIDSNTQLANELAAIKGENLSKNRRQQLSELLKDSGSFGDTVMESFEFMDFKTEQDFENFKSKIEDKLAAYKQEMADKGLAYLQNPKGGNGGGGLNDEKPYTDEEISQLVENM